MTIRVLLHTATTMERSALQGALAGCEDIELVALCSPIDIAGDVDVVVMPEAAMGALPAALRATAEGRRIGVVAIGDDGEEGGLYRLDRRGWRFAAGGRHGLADAIRAVAAAC
jgi:hypothetical protein